MKLSKKVTRAKQRRGLMHLFVAGVMSIVLPACGSGSTGNTSASSSSKPTALPESNRVTGYVSHTRVNNATVWFDLERNGVYNYQRDADESSGTTSQSGAFSIPRTPRDSANNYLIVSNGGRAQTIRTTNQTAGILLAPNNAKNVTPITTMVALNGNLRNSIEQTRTVNGVATRLRYDVDIARQQGIAGELLRLAKGIEVYMDVFGRDTQADDNANIQVTTTNVQRVVALRTLANKLASVNNVYDNTSAVVTAIKEAATEALHNSQVTPSSLMSNQNRTSIVTAITGAAREIMGGITVGRTVRETSVLSLSQTAVTNANLNTVLLQANINPPTGFTNAGKVAQTYVRGATVFADIDADRIQDDGERSTTSDSNGNFALDGISGSYSLVSLGGTLPNGDNASIMMAPSTARNITPITTIVELAGESLRAKLGNDYDVDIASPNGVNGATLRLAKVVETFADVFAKNDSKYIHGNNSITRQFAALQKLAEAINTLGNPLTAGADELATVVNTAATNVAVDIRLTGNSRNNLLSRLRNTTIRVAGAVSTQGTVVETDILEAVASATQNLQTWISKQQRYTP